MNKYRISLCANMRLIALIGMTFCKFNCIMHNQTCYSNEKVDRILPKRTKTIFSLL